MSFAPGSPISPTYKKIDLQKTTIDQWQVKNLLIDSLSGNKSAEEVVKMLAEGMFPNEDLALQVKKKQVDKEVQDFYDERRNVMDWSDDSIEDNEFRYYFNFHNAESFIELHTYLKDFSQYLSQKYKIDITFEYYMTHYNTYEEPSEAEEPIQKPEPPPNYDIVLDEAV